MNNQDLRKTIADLREEIEQRQCRQERIDHELDRYQQMIDELSQELREVRIQAAAARGSLAGIPRTVFMSKRGEWYHLTPDCNGLNNSNGVQGFDYCNFCVNRVIYPPEEGHRPSMIPVHQRASSSEWSFSAMHHRCEECAIVCRRFLVHMGYQGPWAEAVSTQKNRIICNFPPSVFSPLT